MCNEEVYYIVTGKMYAWNLLVLVSAMTYQVDSATLGVESYSSSNKSTYQSPDGFECYGCGPGQFVDVHCSTDLGNSICRPCPPGFFSAKYDKATKCQDCTTCGLGMIVSSKCSPTADTVCGCTESKVLTQIDGNEGLCNLKTAVTFANETVTEHTTTEAATNRSGCPRCSFCNYTSNRCEYMNAGHQNTTINNHPTPTDSNIICIVVPIVIALIVLIVVIVVIVVARRRKASKKQEKKKHSDVDCNDILLADTRAPADDNADK